MFIHDSVSCACFLFSELARRDAIKRFDIIVAPIPIWVWFSFVDRKFNERAFDVPPPDKVGSDRAQMCAEIAFDTGTSRHHVFVQYNVTQREMSWSR